MAKVHILNGHRKNGDCVRVLQEALTAAKTGTIHSIALVMIEEGGQFRVVGAGSDVDGLHAGTVELFKQLDKLVTMAEDTEKKTILHA